MPHSIVLSDTPPCRFFHKKNKKELLLRIYVGNMELSLYQTIHLEIGRVLLKKFGSLTIHISNLGRFFLA